MCLTTFTGRRSGLVRTRGEMAIDPSAHYAGAGTATAELLGGQDPARARPGARQEPDDLPYLEASGVGAACPARQRTADHIPWERFEIAGEQLMLRVPVELVRLAPRFGQETYGQTDP